MFLLLLNLFALKNFAQDIKTKTIEGKTYKLFFNDEFKGKKLNEKIWDYRTDAKHWSKQLPGNATLDDGYLYLNIKKEKNDTMSYTGSGIISKKAFKYGYYEARFKVPPGAGWHTSFWLMLHDGTGGTGVSKTPLELDICENDSKNQTNYGVNVHNWQVRKALGHKNVETPKLSEDFHIWGCEYMPDKLNYYFDGKLVQSINSNDFPNSDLQIWLTVIATYLGGTKFVDDANLPSAAIFDYVRYYKPSKL